MKRYIIFLLFIGPFILLASCNSRNINENANLFRNAIGSSDYIFDTWNNRLIKYNVITGTATSAHLDPLCSHNDYNCPVYGINTEICVVDNFVYFGKTNREKMQQNIFKYDYVNDKIIETKIDISLLNFFVVDNFLYVWNPVIQNDGEAKYELLKYDLEKKKHYTLTDAPLDNTSMYIWHSSERIYWYYLSGTSYESYSSTYEYTDIRSELIEGVTSGGYLYTSKPNYEDPQSYYERMNFTLYRKNISDESISVICEELSFYIEVDGKIIYLVPVKEPKFSKRSETYSTSGYYDNYEGKVYVMNVDGSDKRLLCDASECNINMLCITATNNPVAQDYIGIKLYGPNIGWSGVSQPYGESPDMLIVNVNTGEYKIATYLP